MTARRAVVTSLLGGYETLGTQPVAASSGADFLCFTDDSSLSGGDWQVLVREPPFPLDSSRSQRWFKIVGEPMLDAYDEVLYIDNSVQLRADPSKIMADWLDDVDAAFVDHSYRETMLDEFDAVLQGALDDPARVHEQLLQYSLLYPDALQQKPSWNGMFAYRPGAQVREVMTRWYWHVLRYSRRDQLSWGVVVPASTLRLRRIQLDNYRSEFHEWRVDVGRRPGAAVDGRLTGPLVGEVQRLHRELLEKTSRLDDESQRLIAVQEELDALRRTVSWRVTAPLRAVRRLTPGDGS